MTGARRISGTASRDVSVTEALKSLRSRNPSSLYVFAPGDDYFVPQAKEAAKSQVPDAYRVFDYAEFEGGEDSFDGIREFLGGQSFGSGRKALVVTNLTDRTAERFASLSALILAPDITCLLFVDPAKVPEELLSKALVVTNYSVSPAAVQSWIRKRLDGRAMEDRAVHELMERTANSFFLMRSEIDKLLAYTDSTITVADIREVVPRCHTAAAAILVEAVSLKRFDRAMLALQDLKSSGAKDTDILFDVEQGLLRLLNAKLVSRSNRPRADLRAWCLRTQHRYLDDRTLSALLSAAGSVKLRDIEALLEQLEDIEYGIKKGLASNALVALEQLLSKAILRIP